MVTEPLDDDSPLYRPLREARANGRPFVVAQLGQSLDGCVATATGDSFYVTGPESLTHLHRLRAWSDVVVVGAGTVAVDDPQLTTRRVPGANPVRVVLDPRARLDGRSRVFLDPVAPTLWICDAAHADAARARLRESKGRAEVVAITGWLDDAGYDPARLLQALASRGLHRVFLEGGGVTVSRFIEHGCVDRLHLIVAPVLIGAGRPGLALSGRATMADCPRPAAAVYRVGDDVLWDLALRDCEGAKA